MVTPVIGTSKFTMYQSKKTSPIVNQGQVIEPTPPRQGHGIDHTPGESAVKQTPRDDYWKRLLADAERRALGAYEKCKIRSEKTIGVLEKIYIDLVKDQERLKLRFEAKEEVLKVKEEELTIKMKEIEALNKELANLRVENNQVKLENTQLKLENNRSRFAFQTKQDKAMADSAVGSLDSVCSSTIHPSPRGESDIGQLGQTSRREQRNNTDPSNSTIDEFLYPGFLQQDFKQRNMESKCVLKNSNIATLIDSLSADGSGDEDDITDEEAPPPVPPRKTRSSSSSDVLDEQVGEKPDLYKEVKGVKVATAQRVASPSLSMSRVASPSLSMPRVASPSLATTRVASPSLATTRVASPSLATHRVASPSLSHVANRPTLSRYYSGPSKSYCNASTIAPSASLKPRSSSSSCNSTKILPLADMDSTLSEVAPAIPPRIPIGHHQALDEDVYFVDVAKFFGGNQ